MMSLCKLVVLMLLEYYVLSDEVDDEEKYFQFPPLGTYPYIVLVTSKLYRCTGVIVNEDWVMTAAHCVYDRRKKKFIDNKGVKVYAAVEDGQTHDGPQAQVSFSERVVGHPKFDTFAWQEPSKWDVALIKVVDPFNFNNYTNKAKFCRKGWPQDEAKKKDKSQNCVVVGYGAYKTPYQSQHKLKTKNVIAHHGERACPCALRFQWKRMVCVHNKEPKHAMMCMGDDGGPLVCDGEVVALTHMVWNSGSCAKAEYPKPKCSDNPEPGIDLYFYLCVASDWLHKVVNELPPKPESCDSNPLRITTLLLTLVPFLCWLF